MSKLLETGPNGIEAKTVKYARKHGCYARKFSSPNRRSVPDYIFITPTGIVFFVEFKSPGKTPTTGQERELNFIIDIGGHAFVVDDIGGSEATAWKKNFRLYIPIYHDGYALIDRMMRCWN